MTTGAGQIQPSAIDWHALERIVAQFEVAWLEGGRPTLADFLPQEATLRRAVLPELVHAEVEFRIQAGETIRVEAYFEQYPELASDADAAQQLLARARQLQAGPATVPLSAAPPLLPGYELEAELGRGGMGVVFRARQVSLKRPVAVKMLLGEAGAAPEQLARFRREAEVLARVPHPNIVQVYEVGAHAGRCYFAMELLEGGSLAAKLGAAPLHARPAAELIEALARAVQVAHHSGVIHRDLKPSNILFAKDGTAKLADFGLAKDLDADAARTASGALCGTPSYMAPEQASARSADIGPATDVYALGVVLFETLTGRPPFRGASVLETLDQVRSAEPVPLRRLQPGIPRDLEVICLQCLHKEPARRYASAQALADDLRRFLDGKPIHARAVSALEKSFKWVRRHPAATVAIVALMTLAIGLPVGLYLHAGRLQGALDEIDRQRLQAERNETEARNQTYVADLRLGQELLQTGNARGLGELLDRHAAGAGPSDRRGFEWYYLEGFRQPAERPLHAHQAPVVMAAFTPDGRTLVTCAIQEDRSLTVWDYPGCTKRFGLKLNGSGGFPIPVAALSPDGRLLAIAPADSERAFEIWDVATGKRRQRWPFIGPLRLLFSADSRSLAVAGSAPLTIYDIQSGVPLRQMPETTLKSHGTPVAFAPDGGALLVGQSVWQTADAHEAAKLPSSPALAIFNSSGSMIIAAEGNSVTLWDARRQATLATLRMPPSTERAEPGVTALAVSPDDRVLYVGVEDGRIHHYDLKSGALMRSRRWQGHRITSLQLRAAGQKMAVGTADGAVYFVDGNAPPLHRRLDAALEASGPVSFSPDGKWLAVAGSDRAVHVLDAATLETRATLPDHLLGVGAIAFLARSGPALFASVHRADNRITLWDIEQRRVIRTMPGEPYPITALLPSSSGAVLYSASAENLRLWDVATGKRLGSFAHDAVIDALAASRDGRLLATATRNRVVRLFDVGNGCLPARPLAEERAGEGIRQIHFADDDRLVAIDGNGNSQSWQRAGDKLRPVTLAAPREVFPNDVVVFSADGRRYLATQGVSLRCVEVASGNTVWSTQRGYLGGESHWHSAAWSPDGTHLALTLHGGGMELWDLAARQVERPRGLPLLGEVRSLCFAPDSAALYTSTALPQRGLRERVNAARSFLELATGRSNTPVYDYHLAGKTHAAVRRWLTSTGKEWPVELPADACGETPSVLALSPDGNSLALGSGDGTILLWRRAEQPRLSLWVSKPAENYLSLARSSQALGLGRVFLDYPDSARSLTFVRDGTVLVSISAQGVVRAWEMETGQEVAGWQLPGPAQDRSWVSVAGDGTVLTHHASELQLWNALSGELQSRLTSFGDTVPTCGAFARHGSLVALATTDQRIHLLDLATGQSRTMLGHLDRISSLAFCPDGKTLASASWDRTVRLWNLAAAKEIATFEGHRGRALVVAFSPDGQVLASGGATAGGLSEVLLWQASRP